MYQNRGNVYLLRLSKGNESFFKIGITKHRYCRFYEIIKSGYSVEIVYMAMGFEYSKALYAEGLLQSLFPPYIPSIRFGGYRECFSFVDISIFESELLKTLGTAREYVKNLPITWR